MRISTVLIFAALAACSPSPQPAPPSAPPAPAGRPETANIRNTEAIGYSGNAIADKVDKALDANEQRKQQLDEEERRQTENR